MHKFLISLVAIIGLGFNAQAESCEGSAMQKAAESYFAENGTIQGSDGAEIFIEQNLKASDPFQNYLVGIYDNNEDGETWTVYYFVMTKYENGQCSVLKVEARH